MRKSGSQEMSNVIKLGISNEPVAGDGTPCHGVCELLS